MDDNFYLSDLLEALRADVVLERYFPLIPHRAALDAAFRARGLVLRDEVTAPVLDSLRGDFDDETLRLLTRYLHLYDFSKAKLRELRGLPDEAALSELVRLPGVRRTRAEVYLRSGVTLEVLAEKSTAEIRDMVRAYLTQEGRTETVPFPKEVNCHRAVAKMLLHRKNG